MGKSIFFRNDSSKIFKDKLSFPSEKLSPKEMKKLLFNDLIYDVFAMIDSEGYLWFDE
jgi:hypothetical protein